MPVGSLQLEELSSSTHFLLSKTKCASVRCFGLFWVFDEALPEWEYVSVRCFGLFWMFEEALPEWEYLSVRCFGLFWRFEEALPEWDSS